MIYRFVADDIARSARDPRHPYGAVILKAMIQQQVVDYLAHARGSGGLVDLFPFILSKDSVAQLIVDADDMPVIVEMIKQLFAVVRQGIGHDGQ